MIKQIVYRIKNEFIKRNISKQKSVKFYRNSKINKGTFFEGKNVVYKNTILNDSFIGLGTYISNDSQITNCSIGRFCSIGPRVKVIRGDHPLSPYVSTHPAFFSTYRQAGFTFVEEAKFNEFKFANKEKKSVTIGNDVWIGADVIILEGVNIGDGAIIGAGAIVTKDIDSYTINVGCPSKMIKNRFREEEIEFLKKFKWWEKDFKWIENNKDLFLDIRYLYNKEYYNL